MKLNKKFIYLLIVIVIVGIIFFVTVVNGKKGNMITLNYQQYIEKIENKDSFILYIGQTGCSYCEKFEPKLRRVMNQHELEIYYIDLAKLSETEYTIIQTKTFVKGTPTTIYIKEGITQADKIVGDKSETQITSFLENYHLIEQ